MLVLLGREIGNPESPEIPVPNPDFRDSGSLASGIRDFGIDGEIGTGIFGTNLLINSSNLYKFHSYSKFY